MNKEGGVEGRAKTKNSAIILGMFLLLASQLVTTSSRRAGACVSWWFI